MLRPLSLRKKTRYPLEETEWSRGSVWVGFRRRENHFPPPEVELRSVQPIASRYTDYTISIRLSYAWRCRTRTLLTAKRTINGQAYYFQQQNSKSVSFCSSVLRSATSNEPLTVATNKLNKILFRPEFLNRKTEWYNTHQVPISQVVSQNNCSLLRYGVIHS